MTRGHAWLETGMAHSSVFTPMPAITPDNKLRISQAVCHQHHAQQQLTNIMCWLHLQMASRIHTEYMQQMDDGTNTGTDGNIMQS
jgi:hypothetical protein